MKIFSTVLLCFITMTTFAYYEVGSCGGNAVNKGYCTESRKHGEAQVQLREVVSLVTRSDLESAVNHLSARIDANYAELSTVSSKNKSDISFLKEIANEEIQIPESVIQRIKEELKKEILEELKK